VIVGAADAVLNNIQNVLVIRKTLVLVDKEIYFISTDLMMWKMKYKFLPCRFTSGRWAIFHLAQFFPQRTHNAASSHHVISACQLTIYHDEILIKIQDTMKTASVTCD